MAIICLDKTLQCLLGRITVELNSFIHCFELPTIVSYVKSSQFNISFRALPFQRKLVQVASST